MASLLGDFFEVFMVSDEFLVCLEYGFVFEFSL